MTPEPTKCYAVVSGEYSPNAHAAFRRREDAEAYAGAHNSLPETSRERVSFSDLYVEELDYYGDVKEIIDRERYVWPDRFAGGMVSFDTEYFEALRRGERNVNAMRAGAYALLDRFCEQLKDALDA